MANTPDIKILAGLQGGGSLSGETGQLIQSQLNSIAAELNANGGLKIKVDVNTNKIAESTSKIRNELNKATNASGGAYFTSLKTKDIVGEFTKANPVLKQMAQYYREAEREASALSVAANKVTSVKTSDVVAEITKANPVLKQMAQYYRELEKESKAYQIAEDKNSAAQQRANAERDRAIASLNLLQSQFPKMAGTQFQAQFAAISQGLKDNTMSGKEANAQLILLRKNMTAAGLAGQTMGDKFKNAMSRFTQYVGASTIVLSLLRSVKQMVSNVVELDSAMVDLQIASGKSYEEVNKLIDSYHKLGQEMGATTIEVAKSADGWLRQGKTAAETEELIRDSMILSKLGQMESEDATKALTSATKGYGVAVKDTIGIVDKFTAVDMNAAVSAGYIATAMAETATSARLSGIEMDKLIGYISTIGEVTQDGAESVGNFLKTLTARMGNIKAGELIDPESSENLSDVEATLSGLDVKLRDTNSEFRNFGEVLDEVAGNWDSYSSVQQRALAVAFSGTRQQEKFLVLMDHYDEAMALASVSAESSGTALEKFGVVQDGVSARLGALKSAWQELSDTTVNSDFIKSAISGGTNILSVITQIVDKLGLIPMLTSGLSAVLGYNGIGVVGKNGKQKYALYLRAA